MLSASTCDSRGIIDGSWNNCQCKQGFAGPRCDKCAPEYFGFPDCHPCNCFYPGRAYYKSCNSTTGQCDCKKDAKGLQCSPCQIGFYYLSSYEDNFYDNYETRIVRV